MQARVVWQTPKITVWHYPASRIVHHEIHQPGGGQEFRGALMAGLEILQTQGTQKWLSDDRRNSPLPADDEKWANTCWLPSMIALGWKRWAIVTPSEADAHLNMTRLASRINRTEAVTVRLFSSPDEARRWLESVE